jgi:hypothetical protein
MSKRKTDTPTTDDTEAPAALPPGYEARVLVLPVRYWQVLTRFADMAGLTVSQWLERYLRFMAR